MKREAVVAGAVPRGGRRSRVDGGLPAAGRELIADACEPGARPAAAAPRPERTALPAAPGERGRGRKRSAPTLADTATPREYGRSAGARPAARRSLRTPAVLAWLRLLRVWHKVSRATSEPLRRAGLTPGQFAVLATVGGAEGMAQQRLAGSLAVTQGNVCQLVDRLERVGLLERRQEGRTNRLFLTPKGRALFEEVVTAHEALVAAQFAALSHEQQVQLHHLLRELDRSLDGYGGMPPARSVPAAGVQPAQTAD